MELLYVQEGSAANLLNKIKLIKTKLIRCNWYQQGGSAATPLPDQIQLKVFVTDRVSKPVRECLGESVQLARLNSALSCS